MTDYKVGDKVIFTKAAEDYYGEDYPQVKEGVTATVEEADRAAHLPYPLRVINDDLEYGLPVTYDEVEPAVDHTDDGFPDEPEEYEAEAETPTEPFDADGIRAVYAKAHEASLRLYITAELFNVIGEKEQAEAWLAAAKVVADIADGLEDAVPSLDLSNDKDLASGLELPIYAYKITGNPAILTTLV